MIYVYAAVLQQAMDLVKMSMVVAEAAITIIFVDLGGLPETAYQFHSWFLVRTTIGIVNITILVVWAANPDDYVDVVGSCNGYLTRSTKFCCIMYKQAWIN